MPRAGHQRDRVVGRVVAVGALLAAGFAIAPLPAQAADGETSLYLVTLTGPGLSGTESEDLDPIARLQMWEMQDRALGAVGDPDPVYRWTTALNGFAVRLTTEQATTLTNQPEVALVEPNEVRRLASIESGAARANLSGRQGGGAGVVIGLVDSGIAAQGPLFARTPRLGRRATGFSGICETGEMAPACNGKLLAARWYVAGFGEDRLTTASTLSALDDDGHGTQMASIAAGNAGATVRVGQQQLGSYAGAAPQARLAVYKACWNAPDPRDDGCATADLVTAIDAATRDGVDVLNLAVGGPDRIDTVELALLGAAEADIVVTAAAGNDGGLAAHPSPWVTTVGGTFGSQRRGQVVLPGIRSVSGAMVATRRVGPARMILAAQAKAPGVSVDAARVCTPGSLDAARVGGRIVICDRGQVGRVDKSDAVALADGVGMVLANVRVDARGGSVDSDFHRVPTVHVDRAGGLVLKQWLARHPDRRVTLRPRGTTRASHAVTQWSGAGNPRGDVLKPDVVAPAVGVLGAVPATRGERWDFATGTSAATAYTSGAAAVLLSSRSWSATEVRSALATSADRLRGVPATRAGAGLVRPGAAERPGLLYDLDPADYRMWLEGRLAELNTPSMMVRGPGPTTRTVTNSGARALYFSSAARGFRHHDVSITPAALRLEPGESATYTVSVRGRSARLDDGFVVWRGATGTVTRIPVLLPVPLAR